MNYNKKPNIRDLRLEEKNIPVSGPIIPNLSLNDKLNIPKQPIIPNLSLSDKLNIPSQPVIPNLRLNQTTNAVNQPNIEDPREKILKEDYNKSYVNTSIKTLIPKTPEIIYAWYDASDSSTLQLDPTNSVLSWNDKSIYGNNMVNSVYRPTYNDRTQNGLNVVNFPNDGQYITCANMVVPETDLTYFIVCQVDNVNSFSDAILSMRDLASDNTWQLISNNSSQFHGAMARSNIERYIMPFGTTNLAGEYQIFELTFNNSRREDSIYLNGNHKGTVGDMPLTNHNGGQLAIFRNRARNNFAQGAVAEVICIGNVIEETRQKIEGYLAWKWDLQTKLPLEHPYRFDGTLYNQFPYLLI